MSNKYRVCNEAELSKDGSRVITEVDGIEVAVFKLDGEYWGVANYCVHQAGPLCEGDLTGRSAPEDDGWEWGYIDEQKFVTCPWHGWKFDVTSGDNVNSDMYSVPTFDVSVEDGEVHITV